MSPVSMLTGRGGNMHWPPLNMRIYQHKTGLSTLTSSGFCLLRTKSNPSMSQRRRPRLLSRTSLLRTFWKKSWNQQPSPLTIFFLNEANTLIPLQQGRTIPCSQTFSRLVPICVVLYQQFSNSMNSMRMNYVVTSPSMDLPSFFVDRFLQRKRTLDTVSWGSPTVQEECSTPPLLSSCSNGSS